MQAMMLLTLLMMVTMSILLDVAGITLSSPLSLQGRKGSSGPRRIRGARRLLVRMELKLSPKQKSMGQTKRPRRPRHQLNKLMALVTLTLLSATLLNYQTPSKRDLLLFEVSPAPSALRFRRDCPKTSSLLKHRYLPHQLHLNVSQPSNTESDVPIPYPIVSIRPSPSQLVLLLKFPQSPPRPLTSQLLPRKTKSISLALQPSFSFSLLQLW